MSGWGVQNILSPDQVGHMSRYLSMDPPQPQMLNMKNIEATWKVSVPPEKRPTAPMHKMIGTDPEKHPEQAWQVVRTLTTLSGGSLFLKTHPNSKHRWADHALNSDAKVSETLLVFDIDNLDAPPKEIRVAEKGGVVHIEYDQTGKGVWVSVWDRAGKIVTYDDATLKEKARIEGDWLVTPTGKFNVTNTRKDVY